MERGDRSVRVPRRDGRGYGRGVKKWVPGRVRRHGGKLSLLVGVMALGAGLGLIVAYWGWLADGQAGSTAVRNVGLVIGGVIALGIAVWRAQVADRQADTARRSLLHERYQRGAELLRSAALSGRLVGIDALRVLAEERPNEYHIQIMRLLCVFVRRPTRDELLDEADQDSVRLDGEQRHRLREDVQVALNTIAACHGRQLSIEAAGKFWLDLHQADLKGAMLFDKNLAAAPWPKVKLPSTTDLVADQRGTDFYGAQLHDANLNRAQLVRAHFSRAELLRAHLVGADLSGAIFWHADLSRATFWSADLTDADFRWAILSGADFSGEGQSPATGLTQAQLDSAVTDATHPPRLYGMVDPHTGEPLRPPERWLDVKPQPKSDDDPR